MKPPESASPPAAVRLTRLSDLPAGTIARFESFAEPALEGSTHMLQALGLTRACVLRLCQAGEPCIIQVRSTRIGVSRAVARQILVTPEPAVQD